MSEKLELVGLGEMLIDFTPNGISAKGNTLYECNPGGGVSNLVVAAARLGGKCAFIGKVGNDMFGRFLRQTLIDNGVDISGMLLSDEFQTTAAFVKLYENGEREFVFYRREGADTMLRASEVPFDLIERASALHFSSLTLTPGESPEATRAALKYAREKGKLVTFDPNWRPMLWPDRQKGIEELRKGAAFADIIKVSEEELELITGFGEDQWEKGCAELLKMGPGLVILTLGSKGSSYYAANGCGHVEGFSVNAVDATGAGDACFGAFIIQFAQQHMDVRHPDPEKVRQMLAYANAAAAVCVTRYGGIPSMPDRDEVAAFMKRG